jgi:hypothetical protein
MAVAKKFEDLIAWQRAAQLRDAILKLTEAGAGARDRDFKEHQKIREIFSGEPVGGLRCVLPA